MIARQTLTYVGARGLAAALNMGSLAVFTRLAPVETYGLSRLILSWALVRYGATCQWPKFAVFALSDEARAGAQFGTVLRRLAGMLGLAGLGAAGAVGLGLVEGRVAAAILVAVAGMVAFEGSAEIARTRREVGAVAGAVVARAVLVLGLGSLALVASGDPVHLLLATALAHGLAALPALRAISALLAGPGSWAEARRLLAYGWPLVLSFGAALAQTIDRPILGASAGPAALGAYGAVADVLRRSFVVFGDSIALSLLAIARRDARERGLAAARLVPADAARTLSLVAAFGAAAFLTFEAAPIGPPLGSDDRAGALGVAPWLLGAAFLAVAWRFDTRGLAGLARRRVAR